MSPSIEPGDASPVRGARATAPRRSPTRRVLVAARHLALDKTSEGLCTARLVRALVDSGHEVRCLTTESPSAPPDGGDAAEGVRVVQVPATASRVRAAFAAATDPSRATTAPGRRLRWGTALGVALGTGMTPESWNVVAAWRAAIREQCRTFAPDLVIVRGGGLGFEAHLAMAGDRRAGPWVAHYHDPYPFSAYPASYAHHTPVISSWEERGGRRILRRATVVSFPSERLADWTERSSGVDLTGRRAVLAHIGGDIDDGVADWSLIDRLCGDRSFLLVHTGTLLGQRSPLPLLRALRRLIDDGNEQSTRSRLVLLGSIDRRHWDNHEFVALRDDLEAAGALRVEDERSSHATACALARRATAAVLIEADDPESPFFPAKLADYLAADLPVIALSPPLSVTRDVLGDEHPLWCRPTDEDAIVAALRRLWAGWRDDRIDEFRPGAPARLSVSVEQGAIAARELVEHALRRPMDPPWTLPTHRRRSERPPREDRQVGSRS